MSTTQQMSPTAPVADSGTDCLKLSIVIEWANTEYNGVPRAQELLTILGQQWQAVQRGDYPDSIPTDARRFLQRLAPAPQLLIVSGAALSETEEAMIRSWSPDCFDLEVHVSEGLEYYAIKDRGADLADGDLILFLDSDVHPLSDWFAHLLGSFSNPEIQVVSGHPFVSPGTLFATAFSLGWTYALPNESGQLAPCQKFYANNIAFRADLYRKSRFPPLTRRTRGAASLLGKQLESMGLCVWLNEMAVVDHPPPADLQHMVIRALAHGRDTYMKESEERNWRGLLRSQLVPARRLLRGFARTIRQRRQVGLRIWNVPLVMVIISAYYFFFAVGGMLTHLSPRRFGAAWRL